MMKTGSSYSPLTAFAILGAAYVTCWIDIFLPPGAWGQSLYAWLSFAAFKNVLRILGLGFIMASWRGFSHYGLEKPALPSWPGDFVGGVAVGLWLAAGAGLGAGIALLGGLDNPLLPALEGLELKPLSMLTMLAASLATGYAEEMFFRFFAPALLEDGGIPAPTAGVAAAALFGISHGSQGFFGMAMALALGLILWSLRRKGKGIHALALGHGIYNFCILVLVAGM
ncbi:MAG: caax amino protease family [Spirochaetes bacterium]|nr:MAG: caax amino protease family [Spirochaetota bacterium]